MSNNKQPLDLSKVDFNREVTEAMGKHLHKRIGKARLQLLALVPMFGHLTLGLRPRPAKEGDRVDTAGVAPDGTLILNYVFCCGEADENGVRGNSKSTWVGLTDPQLCGLLCHEVLHPALLCWARQGSRRAIVAGAPDKKGKKEFKFSLWNLAHDLSFNPEILEMAANVDAKGVIELPPEGALEPSFAGMSAEEIYDKILTDAQKNNQQTGNGTMIVQIPGGGHGIGDDLRDDLSESPEGKRAAKGDKGAQEKMENDWAVRVVAAAQAHEKEHGQGKIPGGIQKMIDDLLDPKVPWMDILSRWIGENGKRQDQTMSRPSRRSESIGEYMPSWRNYGVDDICVVWDTSGSMNGRETEILSEVQSICEDLGIGVRVIICDAMVHSDVRDIDEACKIIPHIKGGGGSDFRPAFDLLAKENYEGVVVAFTDGMISVPEVKPYLLKEVLWVVQEHENPPTEKWGECLKTNDIELVSGGEF